MRPTALMRPVQKRNRTQRQANCEKPYGKNQWQFWTRVSPTILNYGQPAGFWSKLISLFKRPTWLGELFKTGLRSRSYGTCSLHCTANTPTPPLMWCSSWNCTVVCLDPAKVVWFLLGFAWVAVLSVLCSALNIVIVVGTLRCVVKVETDMMCNSNFTRLRV